MWKSLIVIRPDIGWKFTPEVEGIYFRLRHINPPRSPVGWVAQAEPIPNTNFHNVFGVQRLNGLSILEVLELQKPFPFQTRKLAFRQETRTANEWLIEVEVYLGMPAYFSTPTSNNSTSNISTSTVAVDNTKSVILSAADSTKIGSTITNNSKLGKLYIQLGGAASLTNYKKGLSYLETYETPFNWSGEIQGIWDKADAAGSAKVEDFR